MEFPGGVCVGMSDLGVVAFPVSDEGLSLFFCNSNPLLDKKGWEG
jgi:hypothetical protein